MVALKALTNNIYPAFSQESRNMQEAYDCGYYMCQYEKDNIDIIIIEHAKMCQTVMFGEIHDSVIEGIPSPVADSQYVISLLSKLKNIEYEYLALEVNKNASKDCHSRDIIRFYKNYMNGKSIQKNEYPYAKPGWIELTKEAIDIGFKIIFIDADQENNPGVFTRDRAMFEEIKREIFDINENAKVIVYVGANHISEHETYAGTSSFEKEIRPLGSYLDIHTKGRNLSVYMGHTYDLPMACDLYISNFIWDIYPSKRPLSTTLIQTN
jgi:hypothetical protein